MAEGNEARKLTPAEEEIVQAVPDPSAYPDKQDKQAVEALKKLPETKQAEVLRRLGVTPGNPLTISGEMRARLLDVVAEVGFGVDRTTKGKRRLEITTPTGSGRKR